MATIDDYFMLATKVNDLFVVSAKREHEQEQERELGELGSTFWPIRAAGHESAVSLG